MGRKTRKTKKKDLDLDIKGENVSKHVLKVHDTDEELRKVIAESKPKIKVVGTGGAGCNTITRLMEVGIEGVETIAVNTDALDLLHSKAHKKVLIGRSLTHGLGAGANPKKGYEAAQESKEKLKEVLRDADMVFLTCGLGGGTGTGSMPVIAEMAKREGALVVGVVTLPFSMEGRERMKNAREGVEKLEKLVDTLIVIPNDKLLELAPDATLQQAFRMCDEILISAVKGIAELVTKPGLINRDYADVRAVMENGGLAMIGVGESDTDNRAIDSVRKAINNPLLSVDIKDAKGALIHIVSGPNIKITEAQQIVESISSQLSPEAKILWGASIDESLGDKIRTILVVTGINSPQILGKGSEGAREMEKLLNIRVVE